MTHLTPFLSIFPIQPYLRRLAYSSAHFAKNWGQNTLFGLKGIAHFHSLQQNIIVLANTGEGIALPPFPSVRHCRHILVSQNF